MDAPEDDDDCEFVSDWSLDGGVRKTRPYLGTSASRRWQLVPGMMNLPFASTGPPAADPGATLVEEGTMVILFDLGFGCVQCLSIQEENYTMNCL